MQKLLLVLYIFSAISLCAMEFPENAVQQVCAEPSQKSVVHISDEIRFPVAVSENGLACVYAAYNLYAKHYPQVVWGDNSACTDVPDFEDGLGVPSQRPVVAPDGNCVLAKYAVFDKRYKLALCFRNEPKVVYDSDFGNYYDTINGHNKPFVDTDIPYPCMLDGERVFFRSLKSVFMCTLEALKKNEKDLFKSPAYTRKDGEFYPSCELHTCRLKPCYRIGKDRVLLVGPEYRSLEVIHCAKSVGMLEAERLFDKDIAALSVSPVREVVAVRLDNETSVKIYDRTLTYLVEIPFVSSHGIVLPWAPDRVFALSPSGKYLAFNLKKKNAQPYIWDGSQVIVIMDCRDIKNPQEAMIIQDTCCTEMLWSSKGLFLHTGEGGGALLTFSQS